MKSFHPRSHVFPGNAELASFAKAAEAQTCCVSLPEKPCSLGAFQ